MRWSRIQRHLFAVLSVVLLGVGMSLMTTGGAGAAATTEGHFTLGVDARLDLGVPTTAAVQNLGVGLRSAAPLSGSVDGAGDIQIQPSGVTLASNANPIDRVTDSLLQPPLDQVALVAPHGFSGFVDPSTKSADLFATGATFVFSSLDPNTPFQCSTVPGDFSLHASDYDPSTGNATFLSPATFMVGQIDVSNPSCAALNGLNAPAAPAGDAPAASDDAGTTTSTPESTTTATSEIASGVASTTDSPLGTAGAVFGSPVSALFVAHAQFAPPVTTPAPPATSPSTPPATHHGSGTGSTPPATTRALSSTAVASGTHATAASHTSHHSTSSKHSASKHASSKTTKSKSPSTTAYVWKGGSDDGVASGLDPVSPDAVASPRLPQATASASHQGPTGSRFGIGVIAIVVGGSLGGFVLLRSEAKRLLRRRPHAAF
jgi:hypothetical protein